MNVCIEGRVSSPRAARRGSAGIPIEDRTRSEKNASTGERRKMRREARLGRRRQKTRQGA